MFTAPQAGVIATSPATMPEAAPSADAFLCRIRSISSQPSIAAMVAMVVLKKVRPVSLVNWAKNWFAFWPPGNTIEPTLKPYQPTHSSPEPSMVRVRLCGRMGSRGQPARLPMSSASTRPAIPALMCTAVPPA